VGNLIALNRAQTRAAEGRTEDALRTLEVQLRTEPADLRDSEPAEGQDVRISAESGRLASHFLELHRLAAALYEARGDREAAWQQAHRLRILEMVAAQYTQRPR
jgi:hypothetical protein